MNKIDAVIFDIDGTLANIEHRLHFVHGGKKNWGAFFRAMNDDTLRHDVYAMYQTYAQQYEIIVVSGRPDNYQRCTTEWLARNNILYKDLYMRRAGDYRSDTIVKEEIYKTSIEPYFNVHTVVDDRPSVIRMWRSLGLHVIDVGNGLDF